MSKILLFGLHRVPSGTHSFHALERVHENTMTCLFLSHHSTLCSVNVRSIGMDVVELGCFQVRWGARGGAYVPRPRVILGRVYSSCGGELVVSVGIRVHSAAYDVSDCRKRRL